jgi:hypothetical protein
MIIFDVIHRLAIKIVVVDADFRLTVPPAILAVSHWSSLLPFHYFLLMVQ